MENLKLRHLKHSFKIDTRNKVVVCKAKFRTFDGEEFLTTGMAMAKNEEFNEEKGKNLARARAEKEAFVKYSDYLKEKIKKQVDYLNSLGISLEYTAKNLKHQKVYIGTF